MQDLRRECLEARAPSPTAKETMSAAETGAGSGHRPSASSGWRQPFAGKGFSRGAGTGSSLGHQYPQRVVFGRYAKHRASFIASHKVAERVRKMGAGREEPEEVQPSAGDDDWQDEDWYEDEWWDDEDGTGKPIFPAGATGGAANRCSRPVLELGRARGTVYHAMSGKETVAKTRPEGHGYCQFKISKKGCQQWLPTLVKRLRFLAVESHLNPLANSAS